MPKLVRYYPGPGFLSLMLNMLDLLADLTAIV